MSGRTLLTGAAVLLLIGAATVLGPLGSRVTPPTGAPSSGRCPNQTATPEAATIGEWENAVQCLINHERVKRGLQPLTYNTRLARAGTSHARSMDAHDYFSHTEPDGSTVRSRAFEFHYAPGVGRWQVGEDLGWVWGSSATPRQTVQAWMKSAPHRREILTRSYRNAAVAAVHGAPEPGASEKSSVTVAAEFGHR